MSRANGAAQEEQFRLDVSEVLQRLNLYANHPALASAVVELAEAYLGLKPSAVPISECSLPIFFLHTLWCELNVETAARELQIFLEDFREDVSVLIFLHNALTGVARVLEIRDNSHDPSYINELINRALFYLTFTSGHDDEESETIDALDNFFSELPESGREDAVANAANNLQSLIESSADQPTNTLLSDLLEGRFTAPNPWAYWEDDEM